MRGGKDPAQGGGGSLIDMGGHCIDLLEMFLGPVRRVSCFTGHTVQGYASEDSAVALLEFASGALGTVDAFFCITDEGSRNALELHGSQGSILAEGTIGQASQGKMTAILKANGGGYDARHARDGGGGFAISPEPVNITGRRSRRSAGRCWKAASPRWARERACAAQKVLTACYQSARTSRVVEV